MNDLQAKIEKATTRLEVAQQERDEAEDQKRLHEQTAKKIREDANKYRAEQNAIAAEHEEQSRQAGLRYEALKREIASLLTVLNHSKVQQNVATMEQEAAQIKRQLEEAAAKQQKEEQEFRQRVADREKALQAEQEALQGLRKELEAQVAEGKTKTP